MQVRFDTAAIIAMPGRRHPSLNAQGLFKLMVFLSALFAFTAPKPRASAALSAFYAYTAPRPGVLAALGAFFSFITLMPGASPALSAFYAFTALELSPSAPSHKPCGPVNPRLCDSHASPTAPAGPAVDGYAPSLRANSRNTVALSPVPRLNARQNVLDEW